MSAEEEMRNACLTIGQAEEVFARACELMSDAVRGLLAEGKDVADIHRFAKMHNLGTLATASLRTIIISELRRRDEKSQVPPAS